MGRSGRVRARELLVVLLAVAVVLPPGTAAATSGTGSWTWPLRPAPAVLRPAVLPPATWLPGHRGVDLAASPGAPVLAPAAGVVTFAGRVVDRGVLTVAHPSGLRSSFEPVEAVLAVGQRVHRGTMVARVSPGAGHCGPASCLHWGVRDGQRYLDPLSLLRPAQPPVLLPWLSGHAPPGTAVAARAGPRWAL